MHRHIHSEFLLALAVLAAGLGQRDALHAQATPRSVQVVILEHFAAFEADSARPPEAKPIMAVVLRRTPWDEGVSLIVLSPEAATPQTLGAAIGALARRGNTNLLVVPVAASTPDLPAAARERLEARLAELAGQESTFIPRLGRGRAIMIPDPLRLLRPEG